MATVTCPRCSDDFHQFEGDDSPLCLQCLESLEEPVAPGAEPEEFIPEGEPVYDRISQLLAAGVDSWEEAAGYR